MTGWNFADVYEAVAAATPDAPCQIQGARLVTWGEFDHGANALAGDFLDAGGLKKLAAPRLGIE